MQHHQPPTREPFDVMCDIAPGLLRFLVRAWGTAVEVFLRRDFGSEYLGTQAAVAGLLLPVYAVAFAPEHDPRPMLLYWVLYLLLCVGHRMSVIRRAWRGDRGHRYFNGISCLARICPKLQEVTVKKVLEPVFVFTLAIACTPLSPPLGIFLLIGGFCSAFIQWDWDWRMQRRAREMHEAMLEQEAVAERFRDLRNDLYR